MSNFKNDFEYPKRTTEYIYSTTAARLKERKRSLKLTDSEIAGQTYDRKIISRIINNSRSRNNSYLIAPAYVPLLRRELKFNSEAELFWGDVDDESYIEKLFLYLMLDILDERGENADVVKQALIDDVNYAKIAAHAEYVSSDGDYLPLFSVAYVNNGEQFSPSEREKALHGAILRFFKTKKTHLIRIFRDFFEETDNYGQNKGFSKLNRRLGEFVSKTLIPLLRANIAGANSFGRRAFSIIKTDITNYSELVYINNSLVDSNGNPVDDPNDTAYYEVLQSLTSAGKIYIEKLEQVQRRLDELAVPEK